MSYPAAAGLAIAGRAPIVTVAAVLAAIAAVAAPGDAAAQRSTPPALRDAARAIEAGDYRRAAELVTPVLFDEAGNPTRAERLEVPDRAEAYRIYGLVLFFLGRTDDAEGAFVAYLKLDVDGRLDPALVPPEAVVFFEDVRSRHAAELRAYRPKPRNRFAWMLNLLPPAGQFQNQDRAKGWLVAGAGTALLATHLTSYYLLRRWCDPRTVVCASGERDRNNSARTLRTLNLTSGIALVGLIGYGVVDGFLNYSRNNRRALSIGWSPTTGQTTGQVFVHGRF